MGNRYFKPFDPIEFELFNKCNDEIIEISGVDFLYIPRQLQDIDYLYGEDPMSHFDVYYQATMYVYNYENFDGQQDIYAKFGLVNTDELIVQIQKDRFNDYVTDSAITKPVVGDIIYNKNLYGLFEITFVEDEISSFYWKGATSVWTLKCKKYEFSHEKFDNNDYEFKDDIETLDLNDGGFGDNDLIENEVENLIIDENNPI